MTGTAETTPSRHSVARPPGGLHSLLVPLDLTPSSDRAIGRLALLPRHEHAQVALLHVVPGDLRPAEQRIAERDAHHALAEEARHLRELLGRKVAITSLVRVGSPAAEIAACATELGPDLVVMGRADGRALRDAFLGSTAERVLRQAQFPVLAVRRRPRDAYRRPAVALDLDPAGHDVVRLLLAVLPPPRPRVDVVHAFDVPHLRMVYPSLSEAEAEETKDEHRSIAANELRKLLADGLVEAGTPPGDAPAWKVHVRHGAPRGVVEKVIKQADSDLLVVGTRARSGAAHLFLGTVAGDLLRAVRCDVLIVPPGPAPG